MSSDILTAPAETDYLNGRTGLQIDSLGFPLHGARIIREEPDPKQWRTIAGPYWASEKAMLKSAVAQLRGCTFAIAEKHGAILLLRAQAEFKE